MKRAKVVTWARLRPPNPKDSLLHNDTHLHQLSEATSPFLSRWIFPFLLGYPFLSLSICLSVPHPYTCQLGWVCPLLFLSINKASSSYMFSLPSSATLMDSLLLYLPLPGPTCGDFSNHFHLNIFSPIECGIGTVQCFFGSLAPCQRLSGSLFANIFLGQTPDPVTTDPGLFPQLQHCPLTVMIFLCWSKREFQAMNQKEPKTSPLLFGDIPRGVVTTGYCDRPAHLMAVSHLCLQF